IVYDTHNFTRSRFLPRENDSAPNRILPGEPALRKSIIDYNHIRRRSIIPVREFAPAEQRYAHRAKVVGADDSGARLWFGSRSINTRSTGPGCIGSQLTVAAPATPGNRPTRDSICSWNARVW